MIKYLKLCRVHQWLKNLFIFAPIFFAFHFNDYEAFINALYAFIGFSFIASSIYIINDWKDIEADRFHPTKKNRPLASGAIAPKSAFILFTILAILGVFIYIYILKSPFATILLIFYFLLNIAYSIRLKQIPIVDISIVASGFVIRLFIGSIVTQIVLSYWLILLTFLLALLLVIGKRRHDVILFEQTRQQMRKSIIGYNLEFLNAIIIMTVTSILMCYLMYTISPDVVHRNGEYLYLTSLFVLLGLFRYLQVIFVEKKGDSPTKLLTTDRFLQIDIVLWVISFISISYIFKYF
jgi:4-hydroxybenzoate polyprenyltransferase and related prenyltransferases